MSWRHDPRLAYLLVNLSCLLWASNVTLGRLLRDDVGPFALTAARFTVAGLLYGILLRRATTSSKRFGRDWFLLAGMGLVGIFGFNSLLYSGLKLTTATNAVLISGTGPLITAILAALILREKLSRRHILGAFISLAGVGLIITAGSWQVLQRWHTNLGDLIVLLAVVLWALYSVFSRMTTRSHSALSVTAVSTWLALPLLYPAVAIEWQYEPTSLHWYVILAAIYIGVFPSVVAYLAWNEGVRRVGPGRAMAFYNMLPLYGTLFGVTFLGETFGLAQFIGGSLVISGSLTSVWPELVRRSAQPSNELLT